MGETSLKPKKRHWSISVWLTIIILANAAGAVFTVMKREQLQAILPDYPQWGTWATAALAALNVVSAIAILSWKRWGFYGVVASSLVACILNMYYGLGAGRPS